MRGGIFYAIKTRFQGFRSRHTIKGYSSGDYSKLQTVASSLCRISRLKELLKFRMYDILTCVNIF